MSAACHRSMDQVFDHYQCERRPHGSPVDKSSAQSLDTVRTLHQTVVSLRTALEEARREIDTLKKQIIITNDIEEGKIYRSQDNLSKPETKDNSAGARAESAGAEKSAPFDDNKCHRSSVECDPKAEHISHHKPRPTASQTTADKLQFSVHSLPSGNSTNLKKSVMASKIDVKIKLSSNIKIDGGGESSSSEMTSGALRIKSVC